MVSNPFKLIENKVGVLYIGKEQSRLVFFFLHVRSSIGSVKQKKRKNIYERKIIVNIRFLSI